MSPEESYVIKLQKTIKQAKILSPLKNFEEETLTFEYRTDPLTGRNTTVIPGMLNYVGKFMVSDAEMLKGLVDKTMQLARFAPKACKLRLRCFQKTSCPKEE